MRPLLAKLNLHNTRCFNLVYVFCTFISLLVSSPYTDIDSPASRPESSSYFLLVQFWCLVPFGRGRTLSQEPLSTYLHKLQPFASSTGAKHHPHPPPYLTFPGKGKRAQGKGGGRIEPPDSTEWPARASWTSDQERRTWANETVADEVLRPTDSLEVLFSAEAWTWPYYPRRGLSH